MNEIPAGRGRRIASGIAVVALSSVVALLLIEVGLRRFSPEFRKWEPQYLIIDTEGELFAKSADERLLYEMKPNVESRALGEITRTNALGFRDRDYAIPKPSGTFRVVGLGDSIAFGLRIPLEDSFQKRIERELVERGEAVEVVNCAVPGYNMIQIRENYVLKAHRYEPDLVLLSYFPDDFFQPKIPRRAEYWRQLLEVHSHLYKFVRWRLQATRTSAGGGLAHYYSDQAAIAEGKRALRMLYDDLAVAGISLYVVIHPTLEPEFAERPHFVQYVEDALAGTDVPVLNLFPLYMAAGKPIESYRFEPRDYTHPGVEGHALIAEWILGDWERRGLTPVAGRTEVPDPVGGDR